MGAILFFLVFSSSIAGSSASMSLTFVFDTTVSMEDDLHGAIEGSEAILKTESKRLPAITNYIFSPFNDPKFGPVEKFTSMKKFIRRLNDVHVEGGDDCPEMAMSGLKLALEASEPGSLLFLFTDASAKDHQKVNEVLQLIQVKHSRIFYVLTGSCEGPKDPGYQVFEKTATLSGGQIFHVEKKDVGKIILSVVQANVPIYTYKGPMLDSSPAGFKGEKKQMKSMVIPLPMDSNLDGFIATVSARKVEIKLVNPAGEPESKMTTPVSLKNVKSVTKLFEGDKKYIGVWNLTISSSDVHVDVRVMGLNKEKLDFGFKEKDKDDIVTSPLKKAPSPYQLLVDLENMGGLKPETVSLRRIDAVETSQKDTYKLTSLKPKIDKFTYGTGPSENVAIPEGVFMIEIKGTDKEGNKFQRTTENSITATDSPIVQETVPPSTDQNSTAPSGTGATDVPEGKPTDLPNNEETNVSIAVQNLSSIKPINALTGAPNKDGQEQEQNEEELKVSPNVPNNTVVDAERQVQNTSSNIPNLAATDVRKGVKDTNDQQNLSSDMPNNSNNEQTGMPNQEENLPSDGPNKEATVVPEDENKLPSNAPSNEATVLPGENKLPSIAPSNEATVLPQDESKPPSNASSNEATVLPQGENKLPSNTPGNEATVLPQDGNKQPSNIVSIQTKNIHREEKNVQANMVETKPNEGTNDDRKTPSPKTVQRFEVSIVKVTETDVEAVIKSLPTDASDSEEQGVHQPKHLKDLVSKQTGRSGRVILSDVTKVVNKFQENKTKDEAKCTGHGQAYCKCEPGYEGEECEKAPQVPHTLAKRCLQYSPKQRADNKTGPNPQVGCGGDITCLPEDLHCLFGGCDYPIGWCLPLSMKKLNAFIQLIKVEVLKKVNFDKK